MSNISLDANWKVYSDAKFLGAYSFADGEKKTVTIRDVMQEQVVGDRGVSSLCLILYFVEDIKPMVLNKTNSKTIDQVCHTRKMSDWIGKKIVLGVDPTVRFGGRTVPAVRVLNEQPVSVVADLKCENCGNTIKAFGKMTAGQVAQMAHEKFGKYLCTDCGQKAMKG